MLNDSHVEFPNDDDQHALRIPTSTASVFHSNSPASENSWTKPRGDTEWDKVEPEAEVEEHISKEERDRQEDDEDENEDDERTRPHFPNITDAEEWHEGKQSEDEDGEFEQEETASNTTQVKPAGYTVRDKAMARIVALCGLMVLMLAMILSVEKPPKSHMNASPEEDIRSFVTVETEKVELETIEDMQTDSLTYFAQAKCVHALSVEAAREALLIESGA